MRLHALKHLAESAKVLGHSHRIIVLGSASLLATFPELGEIEGPVEMTLDADLLPQPVDEGIARVLTEAIGPASFFEQRHGYHADVLRPEITALLPRGWESRLVPLADVEAVFCLEACDACVAKLVAGREKDAAVLRYLLSEGKIRLGTLRERFGMTDLGENEQKTAGRMLADLAAELGAGD